MRRALPLLLLPLLAAGATPVKPGAPLIDDQLEEARAEQQAAEREAARLTKVAGQAKDALDRLAAEQAAAVQEINASESRITTAEAELRLASARLALSRRQLEQAQRPVRALLAGLVTMARRPPILALLDKGGVEELVRTRLLLDSTLPVIRSRTASLAATITAGSRLEADAARSRAALLAERQDLRTRQARLAELEQRALDVAVARGGEALAASDRAIAGQQSIASTADPRAALAMASELIAGEMVPLRPAPSAGAGTAAPFDYRLPAGAPVSRGLAEIDNGGVRSRGLTLATARGTQLRVPAAGTVRFSGPFRDYDGVLVIDHGAGWVSVIVNLASPLKVGDRVGQSDALGRALGPIEVELSHNGQHLSPALIAGSSHPLSKVGKGG